MDYTHDYTYPDCVYLLRPFISSFPRLMMVGYRETSYVYSSGFPESTYIYLSSTFRENNNMI